MESNDKKRKRDDKDDVSSQKEDTVRVTDEQEIGGETKEVSSAHPGTKTSTRYASLQRPNGQQGMNPRNISMGIFGSRGERIKHTVHDGALKLPASSIEILNNIQQECAYQTTQNPTTTFELPAIDGVLRPTVDSSQKVIIITELTATEERPTPTVTPINPMDDDLQQQPPPPEQDKQSKWETQARNWKLKLQQPKSADTAERIRGGGGSDVIMDDASSDAQKPEATHNSADQIMTDASAAGEYKSEETQSASEPFDPSRTNQEETEATIAEAFLPPERADEGAADGEMASPAATASAEATAQQPSAGMSTDASVTPTSDTSAPIAMQASTSTAPSPDTKSTVPTTQTPTSLATSSALPNSTETTTAPTAGAAAAAAAVTAISDSQKAPSSLGHATRTPISSSSSTTTAAPKTKVPAVIPLPEKPRPQWEQQMPGPNDEMQTEPKTPKPSWYGADTISDLERRMLPEWFDGSAIHRTPDSYKQARERIIEISDKLGQRFVTGTLVRRTIPGDAGSLLRLHAFLTTWGFINEDAINDTAPTASGFREPSHGQKTNVIWNATARDELMEAVVDESKKRRKVDDDTSFVPIDWDVVSKRVGNGASAAECEKVFLALPLEEAVKTQEERSITPDVTSSEQKVDSTVESTMDLEESILKDIVEKARPEVVKAATNAALAATDDVTEAQNAGLLAVVASEAAVRAKEEEDTVSRLLTELQEQRLQKLENRLALLDDIESILEAERVALELERRDLYTARCRHWFGSAS